MKDLINEPYMNSLGQKHDPQQLNKIITSDATLDAYKSKLLSKKHVSIKDAKESQKVYQTTQAL